MAYQSLQKLFHADPSSDRFEANEANATRRLNAESTFRTGIDTENGELFLAVPRELSLLNEQVLRRERDVSASLDALPPVARAALVRNLVVDEVVSSNDLEGVHSTRRQINDLLHAAPGTTSSPAARRFREFALLYLGLSDERRMFPQTPEDVRGIYDLVMQGEDLGNDAPDGRLFRNGYVDVWGQGGRHLHQGLYPEPAIIDGIERMLAIVNSQDIPQTYSAIVGHYVFEYIHPFYDGNGRTGRYLLALHLSRQLSLATTLSLSRTIAENRGAYYRSFRDVEHALNHGELTLFVLAMLEDIAIAQDELVVDLGERRLLLEEARERTAAYVRSRHLPHQQGEVVDQLVQLELFAPFPEATVGEIATHLSLSPQQARRHVARLQNEGLVVATSARPLMLALSQEARASLGLSR